jgi:hypothetical protein
VKRLYNRLVLGLATTDLLYSLHLTIFAVTIRTQDRQPGPACSYEGFVHTALVLPSIYYNGFLSIYFVLTICESKRDVVQRIEPCAHVFCLGLPILVGLIGCRAWNVRSWKSRCLQLLDLSPQMTPPLVCERDGTGCYNPVQPTDHHSGNLPPVVSSCVRDHCVLSLFVNSYRIYLQARTLEAANRNYILPNAISIRDTSAEKIVYERIDFAADSRSPECHSNHSSIVSCTWGALS